MSDRPFPKMLCATASLWLIFLAFTPLHAKEFELIVGKEKQQKMRFGMDYERLWYWSNGLDAEERALLAKWSVVDTEIDYIRVAINAGYELKEGQLNPKAYTKKIIPMMKVMQTANPNIKFFASPRPLDEAEKKTSWQPYPRWITGDTEKKGKFDFKWEKCAKYLLQYLQLMKKHGFKISFLDITNEWQGSSGKNGRLTATDAQKITEYLKTKLPRDEMPLIVAPSSWNYQQGASWLRSLKSDRTRKAINIASSHNTNRTGTASNFAQTARQVLGKEVEVWNTELHGWKSTSKENEVTSFYYMLEIIRAGFSGINGWLALGTKNQGHSYFLSKSGKAVPNVKYYLFKKLSTTSNYGHALNILEEPSQLSHTAALIKGNLMTVWVINQNNTEVPIKITPKGRTLKNQTVTQTRWTNPKDVKGFETKIPLTSNRNLSSTIPPKSCLLYTSPSPRDQRGSRMPSSA